MPITSKQGNIVESKAEVIAHGCNCFHKMGAGAAKAISEKWWKAARVDSEASDYGDRGKLGWYTVAEISRERKPFYIFNLYTQYNYGTKQRQIDYDALYKALTKLNGFVKEKEKLAGADENSWVIAMPAIGCGLAGGSRRILSAMLQSIFDKDREIHVYGLEKQE